MEPQIDWVDRWNTHLRQQAREGACYLAVLCTECNMTAAKCNHARDAWILREKNRLFPGTIEAPYTCYFCKKGAFNVWESFSADSMQHEHCCEECLDGKSNDPRHLEAYSKIVNK